MKFKCVRKRIRRSRRGRLKKQLDKMRTEQQQKRKEQRRQEVKDGGMAVDQ